MIREQFGTNTPLYHNRHFNNRGQLYDVRLGTNGGDEWTWNRGALRIYNNASYIVGNGGTNNNGNVYRVDHFVPLNDAASSWFMPVDYYGFDELNRITGIWEQTYDSTGYANYNALNQTYTYDRYGNRTVSGTLNVVSPSFKYVPASNRQKAPTDTDTDATTDKMRYDAVGNLIKDTHTQTTNSGDRTYDINNQMLSAVGLNGLLDSYAYDAAGHRIRRSINNGSSNWWQVYGIGGEVVAEYAAGANPSILADATGTLAGISRHDYLPFGEELYAGVGGRDFTKGYTGDCVRDKFVGYERDAETGLDYAEARYYGSVYGRFTSVDPAMGSARKSMPQSWNRYTYVMNQPLSLVDPTGEFWISNQTGYERDLQLNRKGSPTDEERTKYTTGAYLGYQIIEDNTIVQFGGGGTGHFAQYNHERAVLGDDGEIHVIRSNAGDKIGALAIAMYFSAGMIAISAPEVTALSALEQAILIATLYGMGDENEEGGAKLSTPPAQGDIRVGRWMSQGELQAMQKTGMVQESMSGTTHVAFPNDINAFKAANPGSVYVEFDVPGSSVKPTQPGWGKIVGSNSLEGRLAAKKGQPVPQMPAAQNIRPIVSVFIPKSRKGR